MITYTSKVGKECSLTLKTDDYTMFRKIEDCIRTCVDEANNKTSTKKILNEDIEKK